MLVNITRYNQEILAIVEGKSLPWLHRQIKEGNWKYKWNPKHDMESRETNECHYSCYCHHNFANIGYSS